MESYMQQSMRTALFCAGFFFFASSCSKEEVPFIPTGDFLGSDNFGAANQPFTIVESQDGSYLVSGGAETNPYGLLVTRTKTGNLVPEQVFPHGAIYSGGGCGGCYLAKPYLMKIYGEVIIVSETEVTLDLLFRKRYQGEDEFGSEGDLIYTLIKQ